jgi:hypothetical protein
MRIPVSTVALIFTGLLCGCDRSRPTEETVLNGPHHGTTLQLPEKKGYVELVNEPEVKDRRSNEPTSIVAYYLQSDAKTPLSPLPSDVSFQIAVSGGRGGRGAKDSPKSVPLTPEPKADDPAGAGRFASKPGPYQLPNLRGTVNSTIDGQQVSIVFQGGR